MVVINPLTVEKWLKNADCPVMAFSIPPSSSKAVFTDGGRWEVPGLEEKRLDGSQLGAEMDPNPSGGGGVRS